VAAKARILLHPGDVITFETPGGGGFGDSRKRSSEDRTRDAAEGYV
jgi:N-methylhydantoinase B/oxoprolinase/acetone carboxylase alpha subunit